MLEVNPPFVEEMLEAMALKIIEIFEQQAASDLAAAIVIPDWGTFACFTILRASKFTRAWIKLGDHNWVAGMQRKFTAL